MPVARDERTSVFLLGSEPSFNSSLFYSTSHAVAVIGWGIFLKASVAKRTVHKSMD
jgi:hypothetical protein